MLDRATAKKELPSSPKGDLLARFHRLSGDELSTLVMEADAAALEALLHHPRITEKQALLAIGNKGITGRLLEWIGSDRRFVRSYDVKHRLVMHPRTPRHIALRYAKFLYLAHLVRLLDSHQVAPGLRRHVEGLMRERLPHISLGEKLTMARNGGPGVIKVIRNERDPIVLRALLLNTRLTTADVLFVLGDPKTPEAVFDETAARSRFKNEYPIKLALAKSPRAPVGLALGSLSSLLKRDLLDILRDVSARELVRAGARRVLEERNAARQARQVPAGLPSPEGLVS